MRLKLLVLQLIFYIVVCPTFLRFNIHWLIYSSWFVRLSSIEGELDSMRVYMDVDFLICWGLTRKYCVFRVFKALGPLCLFGPGYVTCSILIFGICSIRCLDSSVWRRYLHNPSLAYQFLSTFYTSTFVVSRGR